MWSSAAPFNHDLWYFRHWTNEHLSSMLFIRKNVTSPQSRHSSHWNQYTWPNDWKSYWREPHKHYIEGFDDSFEACEIERCSVSEPVFKHNHCAPAFTTKWAHVATAWKTSHQWCRTLTPNNIETIERMTCHCFLWQIRRDLMSSSYTTAKMWSWVIL